ncbi:uncharacterized protein EI97DRAFT_476725 [Westerdykella ornata]|uniref:C3H1-type domain-containing protein n=1 Tax=Westerdykella ornata TaxID=318751 RepID=A0A6A6JDS7_WESOR|nr:uncharacterized protein EI97DRAFT_476725 [Westerdykella ornata]KAF2274711.1 hypothetical protein EI97DRAFT_476725 [Westerdykella ornata]
MNGHHHQLTGAELERQVQRLQQDSDKAAREFEEAKAEFEKAQQKYIDAIRLNGARYTSLMSALAIRRTVHGQDPDSESESRKGRKIMSDGTKLNGGSPIHQCRASMEPVSGRWKDRICTQYEMTGICTGTRCPFIHKLQELVNPASSRIALDAHDQRVDPLYPCPPRSSWNAYSRVPDIKKVCPNLQILGFCEQRCDFFHGPKLHDAVRAVIQWTMLKTPCPDGGLCRRFDCIYGHRCHRPRCRMGRSCSFDISAHHLEEKIVRYLRPWEVTAEAKGELPVSSPEDESAETDQNIQVMLNSILSTCDGLVRGASSLAIKDRVFEG